jgi:hypothetical protein
MTLREQITWHRARMEAHQQALRGLYKLQKLHEGEDSGEGSGGRSAAPWASREPVEIACALTDLETDDGEDIQRWAVLVTLPRRGGEGTETYVAWGSRPEGYEDSAEAVAAWESVCAAHGALDPRTLEVQEGWVRRGQEARIERVTSDD